jgi:uncharacterized sporulation protein YeaH/YhbH (DUF444 family)
MLIYLVWDTSGSMAEWGKHLVARGMARAIEQYLRLGYGRGEMKLVTWSNEVRLFDWHADQEFPVEMLTSRNSVNVKALITFFETEPNGKIILLTDGFWSQADVREFHRWKECLKPNMLRVIKIGADTNPQLKGKEVVIAEEFFAAMNGWLEGDAV